MSDYMQWHFDEKKIILMLVTNNTNKQQNQLIPSARDGDITKPENINEFAESVLTETKECDQNTLSDDGGGGVHVVLGDGVSASCSAFVLSVDEIQR